eukprot:scaffold1493_cov104-Skeletonema_dohrnii-CCMP3373.AAC.2
MHHLTRGKHGKRRIGSTVEKDSWRAMLIILVLVIALALTSATDGSGSANEFLQCYANSALESQKDGKIICPLGSNYCIKETTSATRRADCGLGKHSTDVWDRKLGQCVYRKCGVKCPSFEEDQLRDFVTDDQTRTFNRTSFCCNDTNLCNAARSNSYNFYITITTTIFSIAVVIRM